MRAGGSARLLEGFTRVWGKRYGGEETNHVTIHVKVRLVDALLLTGYEQELRIEFNFIEVRKVTM